MSATLSCRPPSADLAACAGFNRPPRPPGAAPVTTAPAPRRLPRGQKPDHRTAATWSLSWAVIRTAAAREHLAQAAAELEDDVVVLGLIEQADQRLAATLATLRRRLAAAQRRLP